jgi:RNA polymerase sigma-54 factor
MPFTKKHYEKLIQNIMFQMSSLKKQFNEIEKLNPKPGGALRETIKLRKM